MENRKLKLWMAFGVALAGITACQHAAPTSAEGQETIDLTTDHGGPCPSTK